MVRQRVRLTLHILGSFLKYFALVYVVPLLVAIHYSEPNPLNGQPNWLIYLYSLVLTLGVGLVLELAFRTDRDIERADGFTIVALTWLVIPLFGTVPYLFLGLGFVDAFFESMSGFTTTGATILTATRPDGFFALPNSVLLWRSLTQWLGGMGVITLFVAILPRLGVGGSQLFDREFPGAMPERLRPRFSTTARLLWTIYVGFTVAQIVFLYFLARLPLFDSACISLCTLPTGGFTPTAASIAAYHNPVAEYIIMVFMFLAGVNFVIHYQVLRGNRRAIKNEEFRLYVIILVVAAFLLAFSQGFGSYRDGIFQAISVMTTTGFATADFGLWQPGARIVLLALMFVGACGGSTGGGIKVVRVLTLIKHTGVMMRRAISPNAVIPVKFDQKVISEGTIRDVISFVFLYVLVAVVSSVILCFLGLNIETSVSAVAATLGNVGPGLGAVGPASSYAFLPVAAKAILIVTMWLGRLELFTVLMIFFPRFWRA